ncbi:magnesium transporter [Bosea sp. Tri-44]|uniref:magnesium transporter n=1 Tax=Bosea sp. Tri-44 TaxID=1972137 RepID=UPI00100FFA3A|nr:magnesium transporter [Bosea sp. Tri-44]RXT53018.1 magnesium transporter [Bosea sp. Tri-44]
MNAAVTETLPIAGLAAPDLAVTLARAHVADIVEALNEHEPVYAAQALLSLPKGRAVDVLDQPELAEPGAILKALPLERAIALIQGMSSDRIADIFRNDLSEPERHRFVARLDRETKAALASLLAYPEHSAGAIMTTEFVSVPADWTVARTLEHVRTVERTRETIYAIYVLDPVTGTLQQAVGLRRLISGAPDALVGSAAGRREPISVSPLTDREEVARLIAKYNLLAVPVVDEGRCVLGIVTVDDVIDAMVDETTEDVHKLGGMEALGEPYNQIGFFKMIRKRAGWLSILLVGEMLTASVLQHYEGALEKAIVLTLFIPLIMSSGGNSGSQATSLIIRALALRELSLRDWWRVALREVPTGLTLGAILGAIGFARVVAWQKLGFYDYGEHWPLVAATVGAALLGIVTFGSLTGSMLPFIMTRLGFDPASASAPFVATLVDVSGLAIYFSIALLILNGTLL